jgi:hypothetical protein
MPALIGVIVLWGSTLGIIALDKSMRASRARQSGEAPSFAEEPGWGMLVALTILLNLVALPYYFYATRRSAAWGFIGFLAFVGCVVAMVAAQVIGAIIFR